MQQKLILMLEDDADDRYITQSAIDELNLDIEINFFSDSQKFIDFLLLHPHTSMVIMDYNSTPDNGLDVLKKIKELHSINQVPVVILSDSDSENYKAECYTQGVSSFIKKPRTAEATANKIETFFKYWLTVANI